MIGTPLADLLMRYFQTPASVGVWETFAVMGALYFAAMMAGALAYRLPPPAWTPGLRAIVEREARAGLDPAGRVVMIRAL